MYTERQRIIFKRNLIGFLVMVFLGFAIFMALSATMAAAGEKPVKEPAPVEKPETKPVPTPAPIDWQERARVAEYRLVDLETRRKVAVEIGNACEDRLGVLIAAPRKNLRDRALLALINYRKEKKRIEEAAAISRAAEAEKVKKEEVEKISKTDKTGITQAEARAFVAEAEKVLGKPQPLDTSEPEPVKEE